MSLNRSQLVFNYAWSYDIKYNDINPSDTQYPAWFECYFAEGRERNN